MPLIYLEVFIPIKDYICPKCEIKFEAITTVAADNDPVKCPKCESTEVTSQPGMIAHFGIEGGNPAGTSWGGAQRLYDGKD